MSRATGRMIGMGLGLIFLAIAPSQIVNAGQPSPALQQETLTLTDAHGWVPDSALDTSQVEAPEVPAIDDYEDGFGTYLGQGWEPLLDDPAETIEGDDGQQHPDCWINLGQTSVIACADGYTGLS